MADDPTTETYLTTDDANGILRLAENTIGTGPLMGQPEHLIPAPISVITSDTCGSQLAVDLGPNPSTYAAHDAGPIDAIYVYAHAASGNAKPLRVLSGPATKLDTPTGVYVGT